MSFAEVFFFWGGGESVTTQITFFFMVKLKYLSIREFPDVPDFYKNLSSQGIFKKKKKINIEYI